MLVVKKNQTGKIAFLKQILHIPYQYRGEGESNIGLL